MSGFKFQIENVHLPNLPLSLNNFVCLIIFVVNGIAVSLSWISHFCNVILYKIKHYYELLLGKLIYLFLLKYEIETKWIDSGVRLKEMYQWKIYYKNYFLDGWKDKCERIEVWESKMRNS